ncbi:MAG TPA: aldo/keto reductase [Candidatus Jacksonbacteria bacterium]|nr:MAG: hypothetical protein A2240_00760 [Candidatus Jacksonbacteria bacterium RIFOXYA2_FULL_43_12]OGY81440.1 MAG: hypothetical protein A2550_03530 [Candidatus Jacksonbacteria bacterium RIFOXYD2_FULL_43_21]HBH46713.1 aldo/keto reductase [Candidatus Jacksonbacteria bacterium]HCC50378.1 aldo/keto reductase [Candidatus Jacksonbacteria bacterium]HCE48569.1 aldo/keto reductase [Candidatus Jacksonbacteria bacterium]
MIKTIFLTSAIKMPILGLGTWQLTGNKCIQAVTSALELGYRLIDTAEIYGNQKEIGQALKATAIPRQELFLTSKVWRDNLKYDDVFTVCQQTLMDLQTDYLDLYLIHWPNSHLPVTETLRALQELKNQGKIRAIGVSNFTIHHLKDALANEVTISNNQVEFHPSLYQKKLEIFCREHKIILTAYSPLAQGHDLKIKLIQELAQKYGRPVSQVVLNWILAHGHVVIPRSHQPEHISDNLKTLDWQLEPADILQIDNLKLNHRLINPGFAEFDY